MFTITSFAFFVLFLVTLVVYYTVPLRFRWGVLLITSFVFFIGICGFKMLPLLLYGVFVSYAGAIIIEKQKDGKFRLFCLIITILLMLLELAFLKYSNVLVSVDSVVSIIFGKSLGVKAVTMLAPIGISYYMLSLTGYVLDVYWHTNDSQKNILKHSLFAIYFPQMTSGPFTLYSDMKSQLFTGHALEEKNVVFGLQRVIWGLFKKLVIADRLATFVAYIYDNHHSLNGFYITIGIIAYAIQLYTDFSGCLDIILGVSETFGVYLPENFNTPFFSENLSEFWRRWHISLGTWFKNYVFYPVLKTKFFYNLGKNSKKRFGKKAGKKIPTYLGLVVNWFLIGIWHGGSIKYMMASAVIPCIYLVLSDLLQPFFEYLNKVFRINTESYSFKLFRRIRTFVLMCFIFGIARSENFMDAISLYKDMFSNFNPWIIFDGSLLKLGLDAPEFFVVIFAVILLFSLESIKNRGLNMRLELSKQNVVFRYIISLAAVFLVVIFGIYGPNYDAVAFIYGAF